MGQASYIKDTSAMIEQLLKKQMTVEEWTHWNITTEDCAKYPNAQEAHKILNTKLYKLL